MEKIDMATTLASTKSFEKHDLALSDTEYKVPINKAHFNDIQNRIFQIIKATKTKKNRESQKAQIAHFFAEFNVIIEREHKVSCNRYRTRPKTIPSIVNQQ